MLIVLFANKHLGAGDADLASVNATFDLTNEWKRVDVTSTPYTPMQLHPIGV